MKNERLKKMMSQKVEELQKRNSGDFEILNKDVLIYAHGGVASNQAVETTCGTFNSSSCDTLTSCGTFNSNQCGIKIRLWPF